MRSEGMLNMYTLKIVDGDLAVRGDGNVTQLTGGDRISQELACWLLEPLGTDKVYGKFGSTLEDMVGLPILQDYLDDVRIEVERVVNNYVAYQRGQIKALCSGNTQDALNSWNDDDVIAAVDSIEVEAVADTVKVTVTLTTASGRGVTVSQIV